MEKDIQYSSYNNQLLQNAIKLMMFSLDYLKKNQKIKKLVKTKVHSKYLVYNTVQPLKTRILWNSFLDFRDSEIIT